MKLVAIPPVFLEHADDWQFPIFLTLLLTGVRPGELTHLLLPQDVDLDGGWLHIVNKPELGWQVRPNSDSVNVVTCLSTPISSVAL